MEKVQAEAQARVGLPTPGDDPLVVRDSVPPAISPTQPQSRRPLLFEHSDLSSVSPPGSDIEHDLPPSRQTPHPPVEVISNKDAEDQEEEELDDEDYLVSFPLGKLGLPAKAEILVTLLHLSFDLQDISK